MAITNAKNNYLTRLFGGGKDKSRFAQQEEGISQTTPGMQPMAKNPAMSQMLAGFTLPGMEQVQQGEAPVIPIAKNPVTQGNTQPNSMQSRYQMLQMSEDQPTRNTEEEEIIKKRARMNAFGKGISALAGLAGVGMGGDAPVVPDLQTPFYMNQIQTLDQDFRNRLQDWTGRRFQVDAVNNQTVNREIDQEIDADNRMAQIQQQGENNRQLAAQRASDALNQLLTKSEIDQIKEMQKVGVDPNSENAYGEYLQKMASKFNSDLNYTKARTNWNNRPATGGGRTGAQGQSFDLPTLQKGRQTLLKQYDDQIQSLNQQLKANPFDQAALEQIKQLQAEKKRYFEYNPGSNEMLDAEVMQAAFGTQQQEEQFGTSQTPQNRSAFNFDPNRGFTNVPRTNDPAVQGRIKTSLQRALSNEVTDEEINQLLNDLVMSGEAEDTESAWDILQNYLEENLNNQ